MKAEIILTWSENGKEVQYRLRASYDHAPGVTEVEVLQKWHNALVHATRSTTAPVAKRARIASAIGAKSLHSGDLEKMSSSGSWQKRFFALRGHYLCYYTNRAADRAQENPLANIDLWHVRQVTMEKDSDGNGAIITLHFTERTSPTHNEKEKNEAYPSEYQLRASTEQLANTWIQAMESVVARDTINVLRRLSMCQGRPGDAALTRLGTYYLQVT